MSSPESTICNDLIESIPFTKSGYEFIEVIGKGGAGVVFKAKSQNYHDYFAIKVTPKNTKENSSDNDFSSLKYLNHPNIIKAYDKFDDEKYRYLVVEYCVNGSLRQYIQTHGIPPRDETIYYMRKIAEAVELCHSQNIAHRDIKPSNVLLDEYMRPKLSDFGISERYDSNKVRAKTFIGTAGFLPPEVVLKVSFNPFKADIWALGVTFYVILTGELPWGTKTQKKVMENMICQGQFTFPQGTPASIGKLINLMMSVDPKQRPNISAIVHCSLFKKFDEETTKNSTLISLKGKTLPIGAKRMSLPFMGPASIIKPVHTKTLLLINRKSIADGTFRKVGGTPSFKRLSLRPNTVLSTKSMLMAERNCE